MTVFARTGKALAAAKIGRQFPEPDLRVLMRRYGGLLGPVYTVACEGKYYSVGELTLSQLKRGIPPIELDLVEVDPDEEQERF